MTSSLSTRYDQVRKALADVDQSHVLHYYDQLDETQRDQLLSQIESVDWPQVARLIKSHVLFNPKIELPDRIDPAPWYPHQPNQSQRDHYAKARKHGEALICAGKVAVFTVAGGQGTRLGWDGPKGTFPASPVKRRCLFEIFALTLHKLGNKYDAALLWCIMTSAANDADTRAFFEKNAYFGLDPADVMIFSQAMMPAISMADGKVLLADREALALSPNGHGGSLIALHDSGAVADMKRRGVEQISYIQIDNPLVKVIDPLFVGLHDLDGAQMSSKMLPKTHPKEKLGNFCLADGKVTVIEYSDLPDELTMQRVDPSDAQSDLRFRAGSIAIHMIRVDFLEALNESTGGFILPFHRAEKKTAYLDIASNKHIEPKTPNAVKLETFVFDALPLCDKSIVYETDRIEEFAPIKNADGDDSVETSVQIQSERNARWLASHGVKIPRRADGQIDARIDISPMTAIESADLTDVEIPKSIKPAAEVSL